MAILPFRTSGASPELAWVREGMVDLLAISSRARATFALSSRGQYSAPGAGWREHTTRRSLLRRRCDIAQSVGAGRVIDGSVVGTPVHLTLIAALLRTTPGARTGPARAWRGRSTASRCWSIDWPDDC